MQGDVLKPSSQQYSNETRSHLTACLQFSTLGVKRRNTEYPKLRQTTHAFRKCMRHTQPTMHVRHTFSSLVCNKARLSHISPAPGSKGQPILGGRLLMFQLPVPSRCGGGSWARRTSAQNVYRLECDDLISISNKACATLWQGLDAPELVHRLMGRMQAPAC